MPEPLYRIVYADGYVGAPCTWRAMLRVLRINGRRLSYGTRPVRVEQVTPRA